MSSSDPTGTADGDPGPTHAAPPPRDPHRVRFWGWVAFFAAIVIVVAGLLVTRPWNHCHCPPKENRNRHLRSLPTLPVVLPVLLPVVLPVPTPALR